MPAGLLKIKQSQGKAVLSLVRHEKIWKQRVVKKFRRVKITYQKKTATSGYDDKKMNGGIQMKDTDWVFGLCRGNERLKDENGIKAHPTQKPLKLIQQVVLTASNKGDLVFDPFMGSGTTAVVAEALGRKWIGIERDEKYVGLAEKRLKDYAQSKK